MEENKKVFKCGLFIGRFQTFHNGHKFVVDAMRNLCEVSVILVGSAQEYGTVKNPFDSTLRQTMINRVYSGCRDVIVLPISDRECYSDDNAWGEYLLETFKQSVGRYPDIIINGAEDVRKSWFDPLKITGISQLIISRECTPISATQVRQYMREDNWSKWLECVPFELKDMYPILREKLLKADKKAEINTTHEKHVEKIRENIEKLKLFEDCINFAASNISQKFKPYISIDNDEATVIITKYADTWPTSKDAEVFEKALSDAEATKIEIVSKSYIENMKVYFYELKLVN